jgi:hypothetical protein
MESSGHFDLSLLVVEPLQSPIQPASSQDGLGCRKDSAPPSFLRLSLEPCSGPRQNTLPISEDPILSQQGHAAASQSFLPSSFLPSSYCLKPWILHPASAAPNLWQCSHLIAFCALVSFRVIVSIFWPLLYGLFMLF